MAKIETIDIIKGASGKLSSQAGYYFYTNRVSGKKSLRRIGNDPNKPPTPAQVAQREAFKQKTATLKQWFDDNKPSEQQPEGTELYQHYHKMMEDEGLTNDFYHFVWRQLFGSKTKKK